MFLVTVDFYAWNKNSWERHAGNWSWACIVTWERAIETPWHKFKGCISCASEMVLDYIDVDLWNARRAAVNCSVSLHAGTSQNCDGRAWFALLFLLIERKWFKFLFNVFISFFFLLWDTSSTRSVHLWPCLSLLVFPWVLWLFWGGFFAYVLGLLWNHSNPVKLFCLCSFHSPSSTCWVWFSWVLFLSTLSRPKACVWLFQSEK